MLFNHVKVIIRHLWRHKGYSFLNLAGLSLGMAACLLAFIFVRHEKAYDSQYNNNIYRLYTRQTANDKLQWENIAKTMFPAGPALQQEIPGIASQTRIIAWQKVPLQKADRTGTMATVAGADSNFLSFWDLQLTNGDAATALSQPGSIVLTESLAEKMFGDQNPIGQMISHQGRDTQYFHVTGILPDLTSLSHLQFDAVYAASTTIRPEWNNNWEQSWVFTYLQLAEHTNQESVQQKFPEFVRRHAKAAIASQTQLLLQSIDDVHLRSQDILQDAINSNKFDGKYLHLLMAVGIFIIILAIINYININTARTLTAAREVGVRKTLGAAYREIVLRFLLETQLFTFCGFVLALLLIIGLKPLITGFLEREFSLKTLSAGTWAAISLLTIIGTGILAGLIPAIVMARINVIAAVKGRLTASRSSLLRNVLVVAQFTIATGLLLGSMVILRQMQFVRKYNVGFDREGVMMLPVSYTDRQIQENLMNRLRAVPGVTGATGALRRLGSTTDQNEVVFQGKNANIPMSCFNMYIDFNYVSFYDIRLLAGRDLSEKYGDDRNGKSYIINETLARKLLLHLSPGDTAVAALIGRGFRYSYEDSLGKIVGVIRDFNFGSLHQRIEPLCISYQYEYYFPEVSVKINMAQIQPVLAGVERVWKELLPAQQMSYQFLDEHLLGLYHSDRQTGALISVFSFIALVISVLGLTGLTAFVIARRTKEIGIRKLLGASVQNILYLLSKDMLVLVLASVFIALPSAWWATNSWLSGFAYHTPIYWWMFAAVGLATLAVAAIMINMQALQTARTNPAISLKVE